MARLRAMQGSRRPASRRSGHVCDDDCRSYGCPVYLRRETRPRNNPSTGGIKNPERSWLHKGRRALGPRNVQLVHHLVDRLHVSTPDVEVVRMIREKAGGRVGRKRVTPPAWIVELAVKEGLKRHAQNRDLYRRVQSGQLNQKRARSPWAVCRAAQKKYGFGPKKYERCVRAVKTRGNPPAYFIIDPRTNRILAIVRGHPMNTFPKSVEAGQVFAQRLGHEVIHVVHPYVPKGFRVGTQVSPLFYSYKANLIYPDGRMGPSRNPRRGRKNPLTDDEAREVFRRADYYGKQVEKLQRRGDVHGAAYARGSEQTYDEVAEEFREKVSYNPRRARRNGGRPLITMPSQLEAGKIAGWLRREGIFADMDVVGRQWGVVVPASQFDRAKRALGRVLSKNPRRHFVYGVYRRLDPSSRKWERVSSAFSRKFAQEEAAKLQADWRRKGYPKAQFVAISFLAGKELPDFIRTNPLTRGEAADTLQSARHDLREAREARGTLHGRMRAFYAGRAVGKAWAAKMHGPYEEFDEKRGPESVFRRGYRLSTSTVKNPWGKPAAFNRDVKLELAGGVPLDDAVLSVVRRYQQPGGRQVNPRCNPSTCANPGHRHARRNPLLQMVTLANPRRERGLRPKSAKTWCQMCGEWRGRMHHPERGSYRTLCARCYSGARSYARGTGKYLNPRRKDPRQYRWVVYDWGRKEWSGPFKTYAEAQRRADKLNEGFPTRSATPRFSVVKASSLHKNPSRRPGAYSPQIAFDVYLRGKKVDTIFYSARSIVTADEVRRSLISHDGYDPEIRVVRRAMGVRYGVSKNPPGAIKVPFKDGQIITVEQALAWARKTGHASLIKQCEDAIKLCKEANGPPQKVRFDIVAMGDPKKLDAVVAGVEYGTTDETIYKPTKGSKKGQHLYRHEWSEGKRKKTPVPLIATPGGKALVMPLQKGQKASDWLRG